MKAYSVLTLLLGSLLANGGQAPKETAKVERVFGSIEDPDRDCKFELDGDKLKLTMKGGKQYDYGDDVKNCPRTLREVKGDFVVTVRSFAVLPENAEPAKGKLAEAGAGLIVLGPKGVTWRSGMHDFRGAERNLMLSLPGTRGPAGLEIKAPGAGVFTRFSRKGDSLDLSVSADGKNWSSVVTLSKLGLGGNPYGWECTVLATQKMILPCFWTSSASSRSREKEIDGCEIGGRRSLIRRADSF
jgi:hypothetical protein